MNSCDIFQLIRYNTVDNSEEIKKKNNSRGHKELDEHARGLPAPGAVPEARSEPRLAGQRRGDRAGRRRGRGQPRRRQLHLGLRRHDADGPRAAARLGRLAARLLVAQPEPRVPQGGRRPGKYMLFSGSAYCSMVNGEWVLGFFEMDDFGVWKLEEMVESRDG